MFVLEINFHDGVSSSETILVRRPTAILGGSEHAHVVIEGAGVRMPEVHIARGVGRQIICKRIARTGDSNTILDGTFTGMAELNLGEVLTRVTALDVDLKLLVDESPDRAGVRILRRAAQTPSPHFPALAIHGHDPFVFSLPADQPVIIGRSRKCEIRLDSASVSGEHARIGHDGGKVWVEDLGSTNGTFLQGMRISGRQVLDEGEAIIVGDGFTIIPICNQRELSQFVLDAQGQGSSPLLAQLYPCLCSASEVTKPSKYVLRVNDHITVGRDPANDIWIGAPHISRRHCEINYTGGKFISVTDVSSNGTFVGTRTLPSGVATTLDPTLTILNFGAGVTLAVCFSEADEAEYFEAEKHREADDKNPPSNPITLEDVDEEQNAPDAKFAAEITQPKLAAFPAKDERVAAAEEASKYMRGAPKVPGLRTNYLMDPETEFNEEEPEPPLVGWLGRFTVGLMIVGLIAAMFAIFVSIFGHGSLF